MGLSIEPAGGARPAVAGLNCGAAFNQLGFTLSVSFRFCSRRGNIGYFALKGLVISDLL